MPYLLTSSSDACRSAFALLLLPEVVTESPAQALGGGQTSAFAASVRGSGSVEGCCMAFPLPVLVDFNICDDPNRLLPELGLNYSDMPFVERFITE